MSRGNLGGVGTGAGTESEYAGDRRLLAVHASATTVLVLAALAAVAGWTGFRVLHNAPVDLPGAVVGAAPWLGTAAGLLPGVAAVALGLRSPRPAARVGLLFAGVFGALATVVPAVTTPAAVALVVGGALALAAETGTDGGWRGTLCGVVPVLLLGAVALSLGAATGVLPPGARSVGSALAVAGLAGTPTLVRPGPTGWALGALAAAGVLWAGSALPFVTGAVTLVAFGLVGTPLLLFAAGVGGCVAAVVGSLRREASGLPDRRRRGMGAALVLLAGTPATVGGATAVVLGAALLAGAGTGGDRR
ncbi:MAG: hypothetical protein V5A62_17150 [Haloarculaceae archaeon]